MMLPRHLDIVFEIIRCLLDEVRSRFLRGRCTASSSSLMTGERFCAAMSPDTRVLCGSCSVCAKNHAHASGPIC